VSWRCVCAPAGKKGRVADDELMCCHRHHASSYRHHICSTALQPKGNAIHASAAPRPAQGWLALDDLLAVDVVGRCRWG
jgi:hypothetical protein